MRISTQKAKEISIEKYLAVKGHSPVNSKGGELYYLSPLREKETTPSFSVNIERNIWVDFGLDEGGSIIDLVMQLYNYSISQALAHLSDFVGESSFEHIQFKPGGLFQGKNTIEIKGVTQLTNYVLLKYFREKRGISDQISKQYLKEVWYENKGRTKLFAAGWKNDKGVYELRSSLFKGVTGQKAISTIQSSTTPQLYLFEGMTDFLSALMFKKTSQLDGTVIILNGSALVNRVIPIVESKSWDRILTFFDNDQGGERALNKLQEKITNQVITPQNDFYKNHRDLNAYLVSCQ